MSGNDSEEYPPTGEVIAESDRQYRRIITSQIALWWTIWLSLPVAVALFYQAGFFVWVPVAILSAIGFFVLSLQKPRLRTKIARIGLNAESWASRADKLLWVNMAAPFILSMMGLLLFNGCANYVSSRPH